MRFEYLSRMAITLTLGSLSTIYAASVYNEAVSGDLSNSGLTPTALSFSSGSNQVSGTTGNSNGFDRDYFTFTVPSGNQLTSIIESAGTSVGGIVSFIGIQAGPQVTVPPTATDATGLLGWTHYGGVSANTDILPDMSVAQQGSSGFTRPLGPGVYSIWIQDFNAGSFSYSFNFTLAPAAAVPEPQTYATTLGAMGLLVLLGWRRNRTATSER